MTEIIIMIACFVPLIAYVLIQFFWEKPASGENSDLLENKIQERVSMRTST